MRTAEIIKEIQQLPMRKRIYVIEKTIHSIRTQTDEDQMKLAASELSFELAARLRDEIRELKRELKGMHEAGN